MMFLTRKTTGEIVPVDEDQLGPGMPETPDEREEIYERIRAEVEALGRGHEQMEPCEARRAYGRPPRK